MVKNISNIILYLCILTRRSYLIMQNKTDKVTSLVSKSLPIKKAYSYKQLIFRE